MKTMPGWVLINQAVERYEAAREQGDADLAAFLPTSADANFVAVLTELARVEMELEWPLRRPQVEEYLSRFPIIAQHPQSIEALVSEEFRQRTISGEKPQAEEYQRRLGIDIVQLRLLLSSLSRPTPPPDGLPSSTQVREIIRPLPENLPALGSELLGFRLQAELGAGAFSRVYLARQAHLAGRHVVLKLSAAGGGEPQKLAQLQHTNIVPIYSLHRQDDLEVICMPYFGACTLQRLLTRLHESDRPRNSAHVLLEAMSAATDDDNIPRGAECISPSVEEQLRKRSYTDGAVWIVARLARGLAHAHERGILHLDLKPANVLLADSGQPMLLDFNLAYSSASHTSTHIGGTLPYMAPEHLQALQAKKFTIDCRADVFSLGVVLYQLLTGQLPFAAPAGANGRDLARLSVERWQPIMPPRKLNPRISPAIEAIVLRCLRPDPSQRYREAHELAEDLERQFAHQPLRCTKEPSWREAAQKWARRHPRLTSAGSVACMATTALVVLAWLAICFHRQVIRYEAEAKLDEFRSGLQQIRYLLHAPSAERYRLERGISKCREALDLVAPYQANLAHLDAGQQALVHEELAEVHFLLVRASRQRWALDGRTTTPPGLPQWLAWNARAIDLCADDAVPASFRLQKALLMRLKEDAGSAKAQVTSPTSRHPYDLYLLASDYLAEGQALKSRTLLQELHRKQPDHVWGWIARGQCAETLGQDEQAVACYSTALALAPAYPWPYHLRGLALLRFNRPAEANVDFGVASSKLPGWWEPHFARALAEQRLGNFTAALAHLRSAARCGGPYMRLLAIRSRMLRLAGTAVAADALLQRVSRMSENDELAYVARGLARLDQDPHAALADFNLAVRSNPYCEAALQNKAHVLAEALEKPQEAITVLDRLLALSPDNIKTRAARAVLLARLQQRDDAIREARACLDVSSAPAIEYQLAGVYALTSTRESSDAAVALELLQSSLRRGWGANLLANDRDLIPLRGLPQFQRLLPLSLPHGERTTGAPR